MKTNYIRTALSRHDFFRYILISLFISLSSASYAQEIEWDKSFGVEISKRLYISQQTTDGGYILGGTSGPYYNGGEAEGARGGTDYYIVKVDANGQKVWEKTFGGSENDELMLVRQTKDGGFILAGNSRSGVSGDKSEANRSGCVTQCFSLDFWIVKLNAAGEKEWDKTFGGKGYDFLTSLQQTTDGGYILGGYTSSGSSGDKTEASRGGYDYWIVKTDRQGVKEWDKTFGGARSEEYGDEDLDLLTALQQTKDGGYILGGYSWSDAGGDKSVDNKGRCDADNCTGDYWVIKVNAAGAMEWEKTIGGNDDDRLTSLVQTTDGGYLLGGYSGSGSSGDKTVANNGPCYIDLLLNDLVCTTDYWVVKLDAAGDQEWDKAYGGNRDDRLTSLQQTEDGGYILGGYSNSASSGDKTEENRSICYTDATTEDFICPSDYWVIKLDPSGDKKWDKTLGGDEHEELQDVKQTKDGGYLLAGLSRSGISGDKTEDPESSTDIWIVKLSVETLCTPPTPSITLAPTSDIYTGGNASTIYLGYGPQSVQLVASGGESYTWRPADGLSNASVANPVFTPTAAGSYSFTITAYNGACSATASVTITVVDVRCGNRKVQVCHKGKALCISPSAVAAHLRNHHEDRLGTCGVGILKTQAVSLRIYPNPLSDWAKVELTLPEDEPYLLELYNAGGKNLGVVAEGQGGELLQLELRAEKLRKGVYYLRLTTSSEVQTFRLLINK
ncbi:T9SS type A sorting domain-containing protein [Pontibacter anaerobius]|uniref:T9SS type A sorting domain-containing protein n=1 Tax=Pontibacter anaerobius TaxID=2993940 RepID=A0ABT3RH75_9BACT|nr:T9SS type A sorting domain-containing protein [Pontibacter anaerobius]MCX2741182.1 T9SS type A sorting domain-containing protein [Pontibacter anaerobius]